MIAVNNQFSSTNYQSMPKFRNASMSKTFQELSHLVICELLGYWDLVIGHLKLRSVCG